MSLRINTNVDAFEAQLNLTQTSAAFSKSVERLSSGLRINRAGDDAAGLAISEKLRSQVKGLAMAQRNAQDGISMIQTGEGALNESTSILQRMRELSVQAANGTLGTSDRTAITGEVNALQTELGRISSVTKFNGSALLDGSLSVASMTLQIGANGSASEQVGIVLTGSAATSFSDVGLGVGSGAVSMSTQAQAQASISLIDAAIATVSTARAQFGAFQNRLEHTIASLGVSQENLMASESRIRDVNVAEETVNLTRAQILQQAGTSVLSQANQSSQSVLSLLR
ncbi:MAG: flagellin [Chloroflexota bacterium]